VAHAPPLHATRAFLSDPFCHVTEDSDGLPMLCCEVAPGTVEEALGLGPTYRYVVWDFSDEQARGRRNALCDWDGSGEGVGEGEGEGEGDDEEIAAGSSRGAGGGPEHGREEAAADTSYTEEEVEAAAAAAADDYKDCVNSGSFKFGAAAMAAAAAKDMECRVGEDEDGMPAMDCSIIAKTP